MGSVKYFSKNATCTCAWPTSSVSKQWSVKHCYLYTVTCWNEIDCGIEIWRTYKINMPIFLNKIFSKLLGNLASQWILIDFRNLRWSLGFQITKIQVPWLGFQLTEDKHSCNTFTPQIKGICSATDLMCTVYYSCGREMIKPGLDWAPYTA